MAPSVNLLEHVDVSKFLVFKKESEDGPDIKGGTLDALIIHATKVTKKSDGKFRLGIHFASVFFLLLHSLHSFACLFR